MRETLVHITTVPQTLGFLQGQVAYMHAQGFDVHAISSQGELLDSFGRAENVTTHPIDMPRRITPVRDLRALWGLLRLLCRIRPAIVHAHTPKGGLLGMLAAWLARVPVRIYTIHGLPLMTATGLKRSLLTWTERVACFCAHRVLCVSPSVHRVAIELKLCPESKVAALRSGTINGIDATGSFNPRNHTVDAAEVRSRLGITADAPVIGYVGRIVADKGVDDLVAAWNLLKARNEGLQLIIAGVFELQDPVSQATQQTLTTDQRIHLLGHVRYMAPVYAMMDIVTLPSLREGFPYVPMEASAMGLPVVATSVPGCIDAVVDGVTGTLVPPRDPVALAEAIARYLDDAALRQRHGQAGRERVLRDFRPEDIWEATYQEYVRLLTQKGLPVPQAHEASPS